jgi:hypothetical protein
MNPLFGDFSGNTDASDFSSALTAGLRPVAFPAPSGQTAPDADEISQFLWKKLPDMRRVSDRAGSSHDSHLTSWAVLPSEK